MYSPIEDYAIVGDCHGSALISKNGSIDWCCLDRPDADPVFCAILDAQKGGSFSITPAGPFEVHRAYLPRTNILRTTFTTAAGRASVTDLMPVGRRPNVHRHDYCHVQAPGVILRIVEGLEGVCRFHLRFQPTRRFGSERDEGFHLHGGSEGPFEVRAGERKVLSASRSNRASSPKDLERQIEVTRSFWEEWSDYCDYHGPHRDAVLRSALTLKLLTYAPTGAIVAAPTTSLPEQMGGMRNWDYRYCWVRDGVFSVFAFASLGYAPEARAFDEFLWSSFQRAEGIHILYSVDGTTELSEREIPHLEGYRGSRPVRIGNQAFFQSQFDIYGEILDWALLYRSIGGSFGEQTHHWLERIVDVVARGWQEPGNGLWEMRREPLHHTFSKVMAWVAIDRAIRLLGNKKSLRDLRDTIREAVISRGRSAYNGHLRIAFEESGTDASLLLVPMFGFPIDAETYASTVERIRKELGRGDFLLRYRNPDGLPGPEGAFVICTFWLVDALLCLGRTDEALALFDRLVRSANDVGLLAEQIDPDDGTFLGNFPQAFSHLALIHSAVHIQMVERYGPEFLWATIADRARLAATAAEGREGLWTRFERDRRVHRWRSSPASILHVRK